MQKEEQIEESSFQLRSIVSKLYPPTNPPYQATPEELIELLSETTTYLNSVSIV